MRVLVLGATGFIGGHIVKAALVEGWQVSGLRRDPTFTGHLGESAAIKWITGDLNNSDSLQKAMEGIEVLFHAAAYYPRRERTKTMSEHMAAAKHEMETVLAAAKASSVQRIVYTSTLTAIGQPPASSNRIADERDVYRAGDFPESVYAETKALMEQMALAANGLEVVVTNPTAVFGPGDVHRTLGSLLLLVARGYAVIWLPALVNVIDVRDVAAAHIAAAKNGKPGERYILGAHNFTVRETITIVAKASGRRPPLFKFPLWLLGPVIWLGDHFPQIPLPANHLRGIKRWQHYNTAKAEQELGLQKRPFEETVLDALAWFKERGEL